MRVITLSNFKGGVSKTTSAVHVAAGLAVRGMRVVLVDTDPQAHATLMFGLGEEPAFHDLLVRNAPYKSVLRPVPQERYAAEDTPPKGQLFIIPSNIESRAIPLSITDAYAMQKRLQELDGWADVIIVDTSPTPSLLQTVIFIASDAIIYPTKCEYLSYDGLNKSVSHREQAQPMRIQHGLKPVELMGIQPTMYRGKTLEHTELLQALISSFGDKVWPPISMSTIWSEASRMHQPVFAFAPNSKPAKEAWRLVNAVWERLA